MNPILKAVLLGGERVATALVPAAAVVDTAARSILVASNGQEKGEALFQTGVASLTLIETDLGVQFATEPDFQAGLLEAKAGFTLMAKAVAAYQARPKP